MTQRIYGQVQLPNGNTLGGMSLDEVDETADQMDLQEVDMYEIVGDLAICPRLLKDLVARIRELEAQNAT